MKMSLESRLHSLLDDIHDLSVRVNHLEDTIHCLIREFRIDDK